MAMTQHIAGAAIHGRLRAYERASGIRIGDSARGLASIRLDQAVGFATDDRALWQQAEAGPPVLLSPHFGLLAPHGPLPNRFTELILHEPDGRMVLHFLDLLVQRHAQLHYRAWAQLRPECEVGQGDDRFCRLLIELAGGRFAVPHLAWQTPAADRLPAIVRRRLGFGVSVQRDTVDWRDNPRPLRMGTVGLGQGIVGRRVALHGGMHAPVRLCACPETAGKFAALRAPGGTLRARLMALARECHGVAAAIQLRIIAPSILPSARLQRVPLGQVRLKRGSSCIA